MFADAIAYDQFMGRWSRLIAPRLIEFAEIPDYSQILDVGCGTGSLTCTIAELKPHCHIIGIDASKEYIIYARSHRLIDRVSFEIGDAQNLMFSDAEFDNILSLFVLNFIPNPKRALYEMKRVTRPGGVITAAVWDYGDRMDMLRLFWDAATTVDPRAAKLHERNMPLCREGDLSGLWRDVGLEHIYEQSLEIEMKFRSLQDYWEPFLVGQGPAGAYVKQIASRSSYLPLIRDEVKRRLLLHEETDPFTLHARAWAVRGSVPKSK